MLTNSDSMHDRSIQGKGDFCYFAFEFHTILIVWNPTHFTVVHGTGN